MSTRAILVETSDKKIVEVDQSIAKRWQPVKNMLEALQDEETLDKPLEFEDINEKTIQKIVDWCHHHDGDEWNSAKEHTGGRRYTNVPEWDKNFFQVEQEMLFRIIMASNYLGITLLLDMACKTVADMIQGKTPEQVRQTFNIPNDLPQ